VDLSCVWQITDDDDDWLWTCRLTDYWWWWLAVDLSCVWQITDDDDWLWTCRLTDYWWWWLAVDLSCVWQITDEWMNELALLLSWEWPQAETSSQNTFPLILRCLPPDCLPYRRFTFFSCLINRWISPYHSYDTKPLQISKTIKYKIMAGKSEGKDQLQDKDTNWWNNIKTVIITELWCLALQGTLAHASASLNRTNTGRRNFSSR
jgi:hypothetical protein